MIIIQGQGGFQNRNNMIIIQRLFHKCAGNGPVSCIIPHIDSLGGCGIEKGCHVQSDKDEQDLLPIHPEEILEFHNGLCDSQHNNRKNNGITCVAKSVKWQFRQNGNILFQHGEADIKKPSQRKSNHKGDCTFPACPPREQQTFGHFPNCGGNQNNGTQQKSNGNQRLWQEKRFEGKPKPHQGPGSQTGKH